MRNNGPATGVKLVGLLCHFSEKRPKIFNFDLWKELWKISLEVGQGYRVYHHDLHVTLFKVPNPTVHLDSVGTFQCCWSSSSCLTTLSTSPPHSYTRGVKFLSTNTLQQRPGDSI